LKRKWLDDFCTWLQIFYSPQFCHLLFLKPIRLPHTDLEDYQSKKKVHFRNAQGFQTKKGIEEKAHTHNHKLQILVRPCGVGTIICKVSRDLIRDAINRVNIMKHFSIVR
jgi:hypothetical protein